MLKNVGHDSIIVADRDYESYNNIAHFEAKVLKYGTSHKQSRYWQVQASLPESEQDLKFSILQ